MPAYDVLWRGCFLGTLEAEDEDAAIAACKRGLGDDLLSAHLHVSGYCQECVDAY